MYVCICNAITDREIRQATFQGAKCLKSLQNKLPVGNECGSCCRMAEKIVKDTVAEMKTASTHQVA